MSLLFCKSLAFLFDRKNTEGKNRNSIKESISAVESVCKVISEDQKATLGKALNIIEKKVDLHNALKEGFQKIYGYQVMIVVSGML
ncbi:hypothetical protein KKB18_05135 [bacterium]|nr:hypothetical protein [bacterium]